jgi:uncharacterized lipoprotein YddW (UPF0748 family)
MNRRRFLGTVGLAAVLAPALRRSPAPGWAWVHGGPGTEEEWQEKFAGLRRLGITGVLVGGGETALLSRASRRAGLAFHRWVWVLNRPGDRWARESHPEWFSVNRNGTSCLTTPPYVDYYRWVCPTRPEVRDYLGSLVAEIARDPAVDGVHLDYIRHPDVILPVALWSKYGLIQDREYPEFDYCYCEVCRSSFRAQAGTDPLDLPDPTADRGWREFRWDAVTGVVAGLAQVVHSQSKPISAAVFPTPAIARRLVRQAWDKWPLDAVFPMTYHTFYNQPVTWIGQAVAEGVAALGGAAAGRGTPLYAGLYLPSLEPAGLGRAVRLAREAGAAGVSVFEMGGLTPAHSAALAEGLAS